MNQLKKHDIPFKLVFLGFFFALIIFSSLKIAPSFLAIAGNPIKLKHWLELYGHLSMLIYIIMLTVAMAMSPIPSEALLFTGGYLYGTLPGAICSTAVIFLGTLIAFWLTQYFGLPLVKLLVPSKYLEKSTRSYKTRFGTGSHLSFFNTRVSQGCAYLYCWLDVHQYFKIPPDYFNSQNAQYHHFCLHRGQSASTKLPTIVCWINDS